MRIIPGCAGDYISEMLWAEIQVLCRPDLCKLKAVHDLLSRAAGLK